METSADLGGKAEALNANYLLRLLWESGKDLHTFFSYIPSTFLSLKGAMWP